MRQWLKAVWSPRNEFELQEGRGSLIMGLLVGLFIFVILQGSKPKPVETVQVETVQVETKTPSELVLELATANGFKPSKRIVNAIVNASETYSIDVLELTAIGIVETGLGKYARTRKNNNGTHDRGLFQINTVNYPKCIEYNLDSPEGSALCAAKLLDSIKMKRDDYLGVYHSKTPSKKAKYMRKLSNVLEVYQNETK